MNKKIKIALAIICVLAEVAARSEAVLVVGTLTPNDSNSVLIQNDPRTANSAEAASFTMPSDSYTLTNVLLRLNGYSGPTEAQFSINLDSAGSPGGVFALLNGPAGGGLGDYVFTPTGVVTLAANTTYWLVVGPANVGQRFSWMGASDFPGGVATFNKYANSLNGGGNWVDNIPDFDLRFEINGAQVTTVPEAGNTATLLGITLLAFLLATECAKQVGIKIGI